MKLSEAMRRGSKMCGPAMGWYGDDGMSGCALTAAMLGCGLMGKSALLRIAPTVVGRLYERFPELLGETGDGTLAGLIMYLNDSAKWSRERIAGYIEAHYEVPTYSLLQMQEYMAEPVKEEAVL